MKGFLINSSKEMFSLDTICLGNHNLTPYWTSGVRLLSRVTVRMRLLWVFRKMVYLRRPSVKEVLQRADLFREKIRKKDVLHLVLFTWAKSNVDLARPKCRIWGILSIAIQIQTNIHIYTTINYGEQWFWHTYIWKCYYESRGCGLIAPGLSIPNCLRRAKAFLSLSKNLQSHGLLELV